MEIQHAESKPHQLLVRDPRLTPSTLTRKTSSATNQTTTQETLTSMSKSGVDTTWKTTRRIARESSRAIWARESYRATWLPSGTILTTNTTTTLTLAHEVNINIKLKHL